MPKLTATPEMKQAAIADEPKQHENPYGYRYVERTYYPYMNCVVQDGILKAAFYLPEHLRLDGNNPAYEVFLDKKAHQFLTYDHLEKKWRDAKLDRLNWPGRNYYATCWASEKDAAVVQDYLCGERGGDLGILDFQRNVRDEQLEQRHKRITGAWDQDLAQVPELPKDWMRWIDKVAVRENFIFYRYKRGGAQNGYCTFCGKEVPISGHPYHNKKGRCACCRHPYYTLEIEPDGTVRQKRTLFDRQHEDIEQATEFLQKWQKVIAARLTGQDLKLAAQSRVLRNEEFIQMKKDRVVIHTGHLAGHLLADVLLADLMENKEVMQQQELPAAA